MSYEDRHIPLAGAKNFRDFGGYQTDEGRLVRKGMLFRSDGLSALGDEDFKVLWGLGIRSICDFRRESERIKAPTQWMDPETKIYHMPLLDTGVVASASSLTDNGYFDEVTAVRVMKEVYQNLVISETAYGYYRELISLLCDESRLPLLIHCSGGKDRTGVSAALILWLLGVPRQTILEDYMHSQPLFADRINIEKAAPQVFDHSDFQHWDYAALQVIFGVREEYLQSVFGWLDQEGFEQKRFIVELLGLEEGTLDTLKKNLLS